MEMDTPTSKETYVENLFNSIAPTYDVLNSILSFGLHKRWRVFAAKQCNLSAGKSALDVCAGTLDLAIELAKIVGKSGSVVAVDFSRNMLEVGLKKLAKQKVENILPVEANAENLPFRSSSFHAVTIGFGLRNVGNIEKTLAELARVVERGGRVVVLEFAKPNSLVLRGLYFVYLNLLLPFIGRIIHGNKEPYTYLSKSIQSFCSRQELIGVMKKIGLKNVDVYDLAGGAVAVYVGIKK